MWPSDGTASARIMRGNIYIDCTETLRVGANTGIQRTVRSMLRAGREISGGLFVPVAFDGVHFVAAESRALDVRVARAGSIRLRERLQGAVLAGSRSAALRATILHPALQSVARRGASAGYWALRARRGASHASPVAFTEGDWLVLLDSTWGPDLRPELARAKRAGARVCAVVYDLIQVRRPDLVSPGAARVFSRWLARTLPLADRILTISASVQDDVREYLAQDGARGSGAKVDWFHLGSDFADPPAVAPTNELAAMFHGAPAFVAVGTLEPRKAQGTLLDAFDRLWARGNPSRLILIGREGFGSHSLVERLDRHAELGRRLFWLSGASDADLVYCYRHATGVLNASLCEGFGLPLVEAAHFGAPVIASDIAVFREVGGDAVTYVAAGDVAAWESAIASSRTRHAVPPAPTRLTWRSAAEAFARKLN